VVIFRGTVSILAQAYEQSTEGTQRQRIALQRVRVQDSTESTGVIPAPQTSLALTFGDQKAECCRRRNPIVRTTHGTVIKMSRLTGHCYGRPHVSPSIHELGHMAMTRFYFPTHQIVSSIYLPRKLLRPASQPDNLIKQHTIHRFVNAF
jgi:hypothetical protein